jgi:hypothetical protein
MKLVTGLRDARTALANRRTMARAHRRLSEELASFRTAAERAEIDQMLSRYSPEETREIREILIRQDLAGAQAATWWAAGIGARRR